MSTPHFPDVTVKLTGTDGNGFAVIGRVRDALRKHKVASREIEAFTEEAMAGDYDHLLQTVMAWVEVE